MTASMSISIHGCRSIRATADTGGTAAWVELDCGAGENITVFLQNIEQARAYADAINGVNERNKISVAA